MYIAQVVNGIVVKENNVAITSFDEVPQSTKDAGWLPVEKILPEGQTLGIDERWVVDSYTVQATKVVQTMKKESMLPTIKNAEIAKFSKESFDKITSVLGETGNPGYKQINAALGIYDTVTCANIVATVEAFRAEFYRVKGLIEAESSSMALFTKIKNGTIKSTYPTEIVIA